MPRTSRASPVRLAAGSADLHRHGRSGGSSPRLACEPNGYYLPGWELAVNAFAPGRTDASALAAWSGDRLIGLMPVVSLWRAYKIPLPALVSAHPYGTLCTPPLDRATALDAAAQLMQQARRPALTR